MEVEIERGLGMVWLVVVVVALIEVARVVVDVSAISHLEGVRRICLN